jgi:hypothetical protein
MHSNAQRRKNWHYLNDVQAAQNTLKRVGEISGVISGLTRLLP